MRAWLIYTEHEANRNKKYIDFYMEESVGLGIDMILLLAEHIHFGVMDSEWFLTYDGNRMELPKFAICRMMYPLLTRQLEAMGIKTFNNSMISDICNDKATTHQYVAKSKIPMVDTIFCKKEFAKIKLEDCTFPKIIKATGGHGGTQVFLLKKKEDVHEALLKCSGDDIVIQPYVKKSKQDLRVYVIGEKIIASILRTAKEGFKSNYCLGGNVRLYELSMEEKDIVNQIIQLFDFGLVGIDFIIGDHGELLFNEIEDVVGSRMLYQCTDINIVRLYLEHISSKIH